MRYRPGTRRPVPRSAPPDPPTRGRQVHYDPRTLARSETPLRVVAHQCADCTAMIGPDEAIRDERGEWVCQDWTECERQAERNARGGW